jgi:CheY-like chemotaxis protein
MCPNRRLSGPVLGRAFADELAVTQIREPHGPYVLIVEDDEDVREMMQLLLRSHGYETAIASNGQEALTRMRERRPCVVLLDMHLPVMDGWEFRERQLQDPAIDNVPVVGMTAMFYPEDVERKLGFPCLGKPVDFPSVMRAVERTCGPASISHFPGVPSPKRSSDLQTEVAAIALEVLERRFEQCLRGGHMWRELADNPFGTPSPVEYCEWCLRVRVGTTFEGWIR